eukprot:6212753-Pleurochrysis_carterae.AAC.2
MFAPRASQDDLWTNLVLGIIGETLDPADEICGVRVVDKSVNSRVQQRFELWYKKNDESLAGDLRGARARTTEPPPRSRLTRSLTAPARGRRAFRKQARFSRAGALARERAAANDS